MANHAFASLNVNYIVVSQPVCQGFSHFAIYRVNYVQILISILIQIPVLAKVFC